MKTVRASDISSFIYCQLAWWYRMNGHESINTLEISAGNYQHQEHSRRVYQNKALQLLAYTLIIFALIILLLDLV